MQQTKEAESVHVVPDAIVKMYPGGFSESPIVKKPTDPLGLIRYYSDEYGVDADLAEAIAWAESWNVKLDNYDQNAKNPSSSAKGIFQIIDGTWKKNCDITKNPYDMEANIDCGIKMLAQKNGQLHWATSAYLWWPRYKFNILKKSEALLDGKVSGS